MNVTLSCNTVCFIGWQKLPRRRPMSDQLVKSLRYFFLSHDTNKSGLRVLDWRMTKAISGARNAFVVTIWVKQNNFQLVNHRPPIKLLTYYFELFYRYRRALKRTMICWSTKICVLKSTLDYRSSLKEMSLFPHI